MIKYVSSALLHYTLWNINVIVYVTEESAPPFRTPDIRRRL